MSDKIKKDDLQDVTGGARQWEPGPYANPCERFCCKDCRSRDANDHGSACYYSEAEHLPSPAEMCTMCHYFEAYLSPQCRNPE